MAAIRQTCVRYNNGGKTPVAEVFRCVSQTTKGMDTSKVTDKLKGGMDYVKSMFQGMGGSGSDQRYTLDELNDYVDRKKISMDKEKIKSCFQPDQHGKMDLNEFCKKMSDHVTPSEDSALRNPKKMVE
ncbi:unnamed protein product [Dicrocoelium dendriticum]|nr:unnamed protein product [Dicrocoelium dendriticum]